MPSTANVNELKEGAGPGAFSPQSLDPEKLMAAYLLHRITKLPKESLADFATLAADVAACRTKEDFEEIAETIREILFPEEIIGELREMEFADARLPSLESRKAWIGNKIREYREEAGLNQSQLGERAGLTQSHISRLETGEHSPSNTTLRRIADALGKYVRDFDPVEE